MSSPLADGQWHRLHPATPLLRGGIIFVAVLGFILANFRERLVDWIFNAPDYPPDPVDIAVQRGQVGWALLIVCGVLVIGIIVFYLSWRASSFRVGDDIVEVRTGILFRTHRRARLDRIQGVSISRHLFARVFGAAKLDISVAGQDAKVQLSYLRSRDADALRRDVLFLASGARAAEAAPEAPEAGTPGVAVLGPDGVPFPASAMAPAAGPGARAVIGQRMSEFLAPELDPNAAPPESVVKIAPHRLIGSIVLSGFTVFMVLLGVLIITMSLVGRREFFLFLILPGALAMLGYYYNRFTKSLRYSIAATSDGVRVGFGLLSTSNDTLPPGRIHAIEVSQPLLWRPANWWMIRINRAGAAGEGGAQTSTMMLPVGTVEDVRRVLGLLLPGLAGEHTRELVLGGLLAKRGAGFTDAPTRAWVLRPFSWKRTGFFESGDAILIRSGFVWRHLSVVPLARVQSIRISQGPVRRMLDLVALAVHTVSGPARITLPAADRAVGTRAFERWSADAVQAGVRDTSQRWAEGQAR